MGTPGSIFISYRRSDSIAEAGRIYDKLVDALGSERIFKDVDYIPYGDDFVEQLDQAVAQCDVPIPLIGHSWLTVADSHGNRRLDDPNDFVRIEIASALKRDILVLPVLVGGAAMPEPSDLPEDLRSLARRNAAQVRYDPDFQSDMRRVVAKLEEYFATWGIAAKPAQADPSPLSQSHHPAQNNSTVPPSKVLLTSAILSGIGGALAIYDGFYGGEEVNWAIGFLLLGAAAILMTRQFWAWAAALSIQVLAVIVFSTEFMDVLADQLEYGDGLSYGLIVLLPVVLLALINGVLLLLPYTRRSFR
mgnify:FL=1